MRSPPREAHHARAQYSDVDGFFALENRFDNITEYLGYDDVDIPF